MSDARNFEPPPPDIAEVEGWLGEEARHKRKRRTDGLRQARQDVWSGRRLVWLGRMLLWALVLVLLANGVARLLQPGATSTAPAPAGAPVAGASFPVKGAEAFAVRFANDYLTWDAEQPGVRADAIAPYVSEGANQQLGWANIGHQVAVLVLPVQTEVVSDKTGVVTVAAEVTGLNGPRWVHLAVPIYTDGQGRFLVTDAPALVSAPGEAAPPPEPLQEGDGVVADQLREPLTAFFKAYAGTNPAELSYLVVPDAQIGTLNGVVTFEDLHLTVPKGGNQRDVVARVRWADPVTRSAFTQTYQVGVVLRDDGRWYVGRLGAHPAATPPPR